MKISLQTVDKEWHQFDEVTGDELREGVYIIVMGKNITVIPVANILWVDVQLPESVDEDA